MKFTKETFFDKQEISLNGDSFKTKYSNLDEFMNPSAGQFIIIPNGFGGMNCPVFTCMEKEYPMQNKDGKTLSKKALSLYERYLMFASMIYSSYTKSVNINQIDEESGLPYIFFTTNQNSIHNIEKSIGTNRNRSIEMVKFFMKYGFLEKISDAKSYIDWDDPLDNKKRVSRRFVVNNQFYRKPVKYYFKFDENIKKRNNYITINIKEAVLNKDSEEVNFEGKLLNDETIKKFTFPSYEEVYEKAVSMVNDKKTDKHGRTYVWTIPSEWLSDDNGKVIVKKKSDGSSFKYVIKNKLKENCPYVSIQNHINSYVHTMVNTKVVKERKVYKDKGENKYYDRFYSTLSLLPKWIRDMILIDNEKTKEIDATALHNRIVGKLFSNTFSNYAFSECKGSYKQFLHSYKEDFKTITKTDTYSIKHSYTPTPPILTNDSHYMVSEKLGVSRSEAKVIGLSYWNSKIVNGKTISSIKNKEVFEKMDLLLKKEYPALFVFLDFVKNDLTSIKDTYSHSNMSVLLMDEENRIMNDVINTLYDMGVSVIYTYDAISVKESDYEKANKVFEEILEKRIN